MHHLCELQCMWLCWSWLLWVTWGRWLQSCACAKVCACSALALSSLCSKATPALLSPVRLHRLLNMHSGLREHYGHWRSIKFLWHVTPWGMSSGVACTTLVMPLGTKIPRIRLNIPSATNVFVLSFSAEPTTIFCISIYYMIPIIYSR